MLSKHNSHLDVNKMEYQNPDETELTEGNMMVNWDSSDQFPETKRNGADSTDHASSVLSYS